MWAKIGFIIQLSACIFIHKEPDDFKVVELIPWEAQRTCVWEPGKQITTTMEKDRTV